MKEMQVIVRVIDDGEVTFEQERSRACDGQDRGALAQDLAAAAAVLPGEAIVPVGGIAAIVSVGGIAEALRESLADVRHCGDYGTAWINVEEKRVWLTMGDADGDTDSGYTDFNIVAVKVANAVLPFWPEYKLPEEGGYFENGGSLVIADEHEPDEEGGWTAVGQIGKEHYERSDAMKRLLGEEV